MCRLWKGPTKRLHKQPLTRCRGQQILAADDVRNAHREIVERVCQLVGRTSTTAHQDRVSEQSMLKDNLATDEIVNYRLAFEWRTEANHCWSSLGLEGGNLLCG